MVSKFYEYNESQWPWVGVSPPPMFHTYRKNVQKRNSTFLRQKTCTQDALILFFVFVLQNTRLSNKVLFYCACGNWTGTTKFRGCQFKNMFGLILTQKVSGMEVHILFMFIHWRMWKRLKKSIIYLWCWMNHEVVLDHETPTFLEIYNPSSYLYMYHLIKEFFFWLWINFEKNML